MRQIFKEKNYKHIDKKATIKDIENKVKDTNFVIHHNFYPFLSYEIKFVKFGKKDEEKIYKDKIRPIKYASHIDRYIYQWYAFNLNNKYNDYAKKHNLNQNAIAYRTCLKGKTNIEFAKEAFDFIKMTKNCYILVSDFTGFFDNIDHKKLKENIRKVIGVNKLPDDVYKVYKSMTRYSYINKDDIVQYLKSAGIEDEKSIDKLNSLFDNISFSKFKKENKNIIHLNKNDYGIPQGSPLSGIYANVYMIDFDQKINEYVKEKAGMYMRYSDDTIIIIPAENISDINQLWNDIFKIKEMYPTLDMNVSKTSGYIYQNQEIISLHNQIEGMQKSINILNFLGFSFDGKFVRFRDKSLFKFYYKYYRKIDGMVFRESLRLKKGKKKHSKLDKHRILKELNSSNGSSKKFIDYVNRAKRVFKNEKYIVNFRKKVKEKTFIRFEKEKLRLQSKNK